MRTVRGSRFAYVRGVHTGDSFGSELRGRFWLNHFPVGRVFSKFAMPHAIGSIGRRPDLLTIFLTGNVMSFDRLKRPPQRKRLLGHKPKPFRANLFIQTQNRTSQ
jgi:hypothetical protein